MWDNFRCKPQLPATPTTNIINSTMREEEGGRCLPFSFNRPCEDEEENNNDNNEKKNINIKEEDDKYQLLGIVPGVSGASARPLYFPVSTMIDEVMLTQSIPFNLTEEIREREFTQWGIKEAEEEEEENENENENEEDRYRWLQEESESSQRSVLSCRTQTTSITGFCEPGAPRKINRARSYLQLHTEVDELSTNCCARSALFLQRNDNIHGNKKNNHNNNNNINSSASYPFDSSVLSNITPLEEVGDSVDLINHMSHLVLAASPTQKQLIFPNSLDEGVDFGRGSDSCNVQSTHIGNGMRLLQRGKRFLEELDVNRDAVSSIQSLTHNNWKCRRMDTCDDDKNNTQSRSNSHLTDREEK